MNPIVAKILAIPCAPSAPATNPLPTPAPSHSPNPSPNPSPTSSSLDRPPVLPFELVSEVLLHTIRALDVSNPEAIEEHHRSICSITLAIRRQGTDHTIFKQFALDKGWWFNVDDVCDSAQDFTKKKRVLEEMIRMHPIQRPLEYSRDALVRAARRGDLEIVRWWYTQRVKKVLSFDDLSWTDIVGDIGVHCGGLLDGQVSSAKAVMMLQWWLRQHKKIDCTTMRQLVSDSAHKNRQIMNTVLFNLGDLVMKCVKGDHLPVMIEIVGKLYPGVGIHTDAAEKYAQAASSVQAVQVLHWLMCFANGTIRRPEAFGAILGGFRTGKVAVLDWLMEHREVHMTKIVFNRLPKEELRECLQAATDGGHVPCLEWLVAKIGKPKRQHPFHGIKINLYPILGPNRNQLAIDWWASRADGFGIELTIEYGDATLEMSRLIACGGPGARWLWDVLEAEGDIAKVKLEALVDAAALAGDVLMLEFLKVKSTALPGTRRFPFSHAALRNASAQNHVVVLQWWKNHIQGGPFIAPMEVLEAAISSSKSKSTDALQWWIQKSGELGVDQLKHMYKCAIQVGCGSALDVLHTIKAVQLFPISDSTPHKLALSPLITKLIGDKSRQSEAAATLFKACVAHDAALQLDRLLRIMDSSFENEQKSSVAVHGLRCKMCVKEYLLAQGFVFGPQ